MLHGELLKQYLLKSKSIQNAQSELNISNVVDYSVLLRSGL